MKAQFRLIDDKARAYIRVIGIEKQGIECLKLLDFDRFWGVLPIAMHRSESIGQAEGDFDQSVQGREGLDFYVVNLNEPVSRIIPYIKREEYNNPHRLVIVIVIESTENELENEDVYAQLGLLKKHVDKMICISSSTFAEMLAQNVEPAQIKGLVNSSVSKIIHDMLSLMHVYKGNGNLNLDSEVIEFVKNDSKEFHVGIGYGNGSRWIQEAAEAAMALPLAVRSLGSAKRILVNISASEEIRPEEIEQIIDEIVKRNGPEHHIYYKQTQVPSIDANRVTIYWA
jgi:cell division GTPase FtsZ